jgi:DNA (cytosine-5)-methyltransferase 1
MTVGSLFTGIGGIELALPPHELVWMCEADKHCRRVLEARFPGVPVYEDVREVDATVAPVDLLTGGYP